MDFIRIGDIVEYSSIYRFSGVEYCGKELGMSVYLCDENDCINIDIPKITDSTFGTLFPLFSSIYYSKNKKIYKVEGDLVGYGSDGEPLLKNPKIIKEINRSKEIKYNLFVKDRCNDNYIYPVRENKIIIPLDSYYLQNEFMDPLIECIPEKFNYYRNKRGRFIYKAI